MSRTRANGDRRAVPASIGTPTSWHQERAIDTDDMTGEWYECEAVGRGIYVTEHSDGWTVGLYDPEHKHTLERWNFDSPSDAGAKAGSVAWDIHH